MGPLAGATSSCVWAGIDTSFSSDRFESELLRRRHREDLLGLRIETI